MNIGHSTKRKREISIIIVTYNSQHYIINCINSLIINSSDIKYDIIIIDNNSSDDTVAKLKESVFDYELIQNKKNLGFAKACNQGIKLSNSHFIFILNPDTKLINDSLNIFYEFMKMPENSDVWCCGCWLYNENNERTGLYRFPKVRDVFLEQIGFYFLKNDFKKTEKFVDSGNILVDYVLGAAMFIRKKSLDEIGLFNELFFLNYEETELAYRAKQKGYRTVICNNAKIIHYGSKSLTSKREYLEHLRDGQLKFFKLTSSSYVFAIVQTLHIIGTILRSIRYFDFYYLKRIKRIIDI